MEVITVRESVDSSYDSVADFIDLDRYPMADMTSTAGAAFAKECAAVLGKDELHLHADHIAQ